MLKVAVYIPNYNGASYLEKMEILDGIDYIVMDNNSQDKSEKICQERGLTFIKNEEHIDRIGNWLRCIDHFKRSKYEWMKFLFIGDILNKDLYNIISKVIKQYKKAEVIIFQYQIKYTFQNKLKKNRKNGYIEENEKKIMLLKYGNIFGAPIAWLISKNVNFEEIDKVTIRNNKWSGDMLLMYQLSKNRQLLCIDEEIGCFQSQNRKTYSKEKYSYFSLIEELNFFKIIYEELNFNSNQEENYKLLENSIMFKILQVLENKVTSIENIKSILKFSAKSILKFSIKSIFNKK